MRDKWLEVAEHLLSNHEDWKEFARQLGECSSDEEKEQLYSIWWSDLNPEEAE